MQWVHITLISIMFLALSGCTQPKEDNYLDGCKIRVSDVNKFEDRKTEPCKCTDLPL